MIREVCGTVFFFFFLNDTSTTEIYTILFVAASDVYKRQRYDNSVKVYRDYLVTMDAAEQKGAQETQLKIARNMKDKGIDNESIAECTDLPLSIIEGL